MGGSTVIVALFPGGLADGLLVVTSGASALFARFYLPVAVPFGRRPSVPLFYEPRRVPDRALRDLCTGLVRAWYGLGAASP
ncbi:hypothetical protein GCM10010277_34470 [Streptomyces longisporoflavus]|nr:hypothetical protein GCM10010277_34470 [Streptomyces longisporoflavus]